MEALIESSYYYDMYFSDSCWKGEPRVVKTMLARIKSETRKIEALKANIKMRVVGLGWNEFAITWSQKGNTWSVRELADHLRKIIKAELKMTTPMDPSIKMPKRAELPILGTATRQLVESKTLHQERELKGKGVIIQ
jgi:hypothetical protein